MKKVFIIICCCSLSVSIYAQTPEFVIEFDTSGTFDANDPIHNYVTTAAGDFDDRFFDECDLSQINPLRGLSSIYLGRTYIFYYEYVYGKGFDIIANPLNQAAENLCINDPDNIAIVVWRNGRSKAWNNQNDVVKEEIGISVSPAEWNGWILDFIAWPNEKRQWSLPLGNQCYELSSIASNHQVSRYYSDKFRVFDHPGPTRTLFTYYNAEKVAFWQNFKIQVIINNPYTVLDECLFYVQINLQKNVNCDFGASGSITFHTGDNIYIPDWDYPPF
ncbi:MAG: hypothetical protein AB1656_23220 [Candidatus Omnitrophota bacterium]